MLLCDIIPYRNQSPAIDQQMISGLGHYAPVPDELFPDQSVLVQCRWSDVPAIQAVRFALFSDRDALWAALTHGEIHLIAPLDATGATPEMRARMADDPQIEYSVQRIARQYILQPRVSPDAPSTESESTDRAVREMARGLSLDNGFAPFFEPALGPIPAVLLGEQSLDPSLPATSLSGAIDRAQGLVSRNGVVEVELVVRTNDGLGQILAEQFASQLILAQIPARLSRVEPALFFDQIEDTGAGSNEDSLTYFVGAVRADYLSIRQVLQGYDAWAQLASGRQDARSGSLGARASELLGDGNDGNAALSTEAFWFAAQELPFGSAIPLADVNVAVAQNPDGGPRLAVPVTLTGNLGPLHHIRTDE